MGCIQNEFLRIFPAEPEPLHTRATPIARLFFLLFPFVVLLVPAACSNADEATAKDAENEAPTDAGDNSEADASSSDVGKKSWRRKGAGWGSRCAMGERGGC